MTRKRTPSTSISRRHPHVDWLLDPKAQTVGELDEMLLKVCHEANNESISDSEFRGMIYDLMLRKVELMEDRMPKVQLT